MRDELKENIREKVKFDSDQHDTNCGYNVTANPNNCDCNKNELIGRIMQLIDAYCDKSNKGATDKLEHSRTMGHRMEAYLAWKRYIDFCEFQWPHPYLFNPFHYV